MNKYYRCIRHLEIQGNPDTAVIGLFSFDKSCIQDYSDELKPKKTKPKNKSR